MGWRGRCSIQIKIQRLTINGCHARDGVMKDKQNGSKQTHSAHQQHPVRVSQVQRCAALARLGGGGTRLELFSRWGCGPKLEPRFLDVKLSHRSSKHNNIHTWHTHICAYTHSDSNVGCLLSIYHRSRAAYAGVYQKLIPCGRFIIIKTAWELYKLFSCLCFRTVWLSLSRPHPFTHAGVKLFSLYFSCFSVQSRWRSWIHPNTIVMFCICETHRLSPENGSVLRNALVILVWEDHG